jgi:Xaa-Pro aminopeptidase
MMKRLLVLVFVAALTPVYAADFGPDVRVVVLINARTPDGVFKDAIHMTKAEFDAKSNAEIAALKKARVDAWRAHVAAARVKPAVTLSRAELQAERARIAAELATLDEKLSR